MSNSYNQKLKNILSAIHLSDNETNKIIKQTNELIQDYAEFNNISENEAKKKLKLTL